MDCKEDAFRIMAESHQPDMKGAVRELELQIIRTQEALISFERQMENLKLRMIVIELGAQALTKPSSCFILGAKNCPKAFTGYHVYGWVEDRLVCINCNATRASIKEAHE